MKHIMKELFYSGIMLQKDLEFCDIMRDLEKDPHILFLSYPEKCIVHHRNTDETHIGYEQHYVTFLYEGYIFYVQSSMYYPFTDENYPGRFNFLVYKRIGTWGKYQCTYFEKYDDFRSIHDWVSCSKREHMRDIHVTRIDGSIGVALVDRIISKVNSVGGYREKDVLNKRPVFLRSETWNDEHKVVRVVATSSDDDRLASFEFDVVTNKICG